MARSTLASPSYPARLAAFGAIAMALGGLAACTTSLGSGAHDTFARTTKCSTEPMSVVPSPDYHPQASDPAPPAPAADPGTLTYWQQRRSAQPARLPADDTECTVFEVTGCGQTLHLCCRHPSARDSTGVLAPRTDVVECEPR